MDYTLTTTLMKEAPRSQSEAFETDIALQLYRDYLAANMVELIREMLLWMDIREFDDSVLKRAKVELEIWGSDFQRDLKDRLLHPPQKMIERDAFDVEKLGYKPFDFSIWNPKLFMKLIEDGFESALLPIMPKEKAPPLSDWLLAVFYSDYAAGPYKELRMKLANLKAQHDQRRAHNHPESNNVH